MALSVRPVGDRAFGSIAVLVVVGVVDAWSLRHVNLESARPDRTLVLLAAALPLSVRLIGTSVPDLPKVTHLVASTTVMLAPVTRDLNAVSPFPPTLTAPPLESPVTSALQTPTSRRTVSQQSARPPRTSLRATSSTAPIRCPSSSTEPDKPIISDEHITHLQPHTSGTKVHTGDILSRNCHTPRCSISECRA